MRYARRTDDNHSEVVKALRALGWSVLDLSRVGGGCPDLLAARNGTTVLVEVKRPAAPSMGKDGYARRGKPGALEESQEAFRAEWKGRVVVLRTIHDAASLSSA